jgi:hypothetical protein
VDTWPSRTLRPCSHRRPAGKQARRARAAAPRGQHLGHGARHAWRPPKPRRHPRSARRSSGHRRLAAASSPHASPGRPPHLRRAEAAARGAGRRGQVGIASTTNNPVSQMYVQATPVMATPVMATVVQAQPIQAQPIMATAQAISAQGQPVAIVATVVV